MSDQVETRRRHRVIWISVLALVLPLLFLTYQRLHGRQMLRAKLYDLRQAGEEMDYRRLQSSVPPDTNNIVVALTNLFARLDAADAFVRSRPPLFEYTTNLDGRTLAMVETWTYTVSGSSDDITNSWEGFMPEFELRTNLLTEVLHALNRPEFHSGYDVDNCFHDLPMHTYMNVRRVERLLMAGFAWHLRREEMRQALNCLRALGHLVSKMKNERMLLPELMRLAMLHSVFDATWQCVQLDAVPEAELKDLAAQLETLGHIEGTLQALRLERAVTLEVFQRLGGHAGTEAQRRREWKEAWDFTGMGLGLVRDGVTETAYVPMWHLVWQEQDCCVSLDSWAADINLLKSAKAMGWAILQNPKGGSPTKPPFTPIEYTTPSDNWWNTHRFLFSMQSTFFEPRDMFRKVFRAESMCRLAITAIAIQRYQRRHQEPPPDLQALIPGFLKAIPVDPMDQRPLRYHRAPEGWQLYGIGENGIDDGGNPGPVAPAAQSSFLLKGADIIWPRSTP